MSVASLLSQPSPVVAPAGYSPLLPPAPVNDRAPVATHPLFGLRQLEVEWEETAGTLWTFMRPNGRPSYNPALLNDFHAWQDGIADWATGREESLRYLVLGSRFPGVFSLGGDLNLFAKKIRERDRDALVRYGQSCVRILHRNMQGLGLPLITIALVQGDALGGGFESLMSFNVIVAERGVKFGLPENLFGLFPGMGAASFLTRSLGAAKAQDMILNGTMHTAEEMYEMGLVHVLAEPGEDPQAVRDYIARSRRRHSGHRAVYQAIREVNPVTLDELDRIVEIWADASLRLREQDLKIMERLVGAQDRLRPPPRMAAE